MSKHAHVVPVASGSALHVTPQVATVGLGLSLDPGFGSVAEKLFSVPSTPGLRPLTHLMTDEMGNAFQESELRSAVGRLQNLPFTEELDVESAINSPEYD